MSAIDPGSEEAIAAPHPRDPDQQELFAAPDVPRPDRLWWLAAAALVVTLALLLAIERWPRLAADPAWRPGLEAFCDYVGCRLPLWHEPSAIRLLGRDLRAHPDRAGALVLTASFRNDAAFAQPWPMLELALSDLRGAVVGTRRFGPVEYLGTAPGHALMAPGESAQLLLELLDPGPDTVGFTLEFR